MDYYGHPTLIEGYHNIVIVIHNMTNTPSCVTGHNENSLIEGVMHILRIIDGYETKTKVQRHETIQNSAVSVRIHRPTKNRQIELDYFCFECGRYNDEGKMMFSIADWFGICKSCIRKDIPVYN